MKPSPARLLVLPILLPWVAESRRDLFVYYVEDADPSLVQPEWIYRVRDSLTRRYVRTPIEGARA